MKLRNKKTGQEGNFIINKDHFECVDLEYVPEYRNLAELNEEWEDYEEPKEYWTIDRSEKGGLFVHKVAELAMLPEWVECDEAYGIRFETEEEAEKALEKLKAFKRLRNEGFRFRAFESDIVTMDHKNISMVKIQATMECVGSNIDQDLDLLFGGEE